MNGKKSVEKFPITVRKGHAVVKIYQVKNRDALAYCVSYVSPTGRQRQFADLILPGAKRPTSRNILPTATWKR